MEKETKAEKCILKCKDAKRFYSFPAKRVLRDVWLYKLGLVKMNASDKVCDLHFSEIMISPKNGTLIDLAVPNKNLPDDVSIELLSDEEFSAKDEVSTNKQTNNISKNNSVQTQKVSNERKTKSDNHTNSTIGTSSKVLEDLKQPMPNLSNVPNASLQTLIKDSSNLLIDYQLRLGAKEYDVFEIPEHIVVTTVVKVKSGKKLTKINNKVVIVPNKTHKTLRDDNSQKEMRLKAKKTKNTTDEVEYIYYMTEEDNPRREREVQVDINPTTIETGIQCDVELDNDLGQMFEYNTQLFWSHLFNSKLNMHECLVCGEIVANNSSKVRHSLLHEKNPSLCSQCGEMFSSNLERKVHEKEIHLFNKPEIQKALRCPKLHCNKAFHSKEHLNKHIQKHIKGFQHKCHKCLRFFRSSFKLMCHQKVVKNCSHTRPKKK